MNTHHHGDHTNGNCLLPEATIIGHHRCREAIQATGILRPDGLWEPVDWGELEPAPPFVTFEHRLDLYVDDLLVELHHFGTAAHTTNDVVAWIPEHRVLFTGDLVFNGGTPFVLMGSVAGSLRGPRLPDGARPRRDRPRPRRRVRSRGHRHRPGSTSASSNRSPPRPRQPGSPPSRPPARPTWGPSPTLTHPERLAGNLHRAFAECEGARPGDPIDVAAASVDMVAFNGGRPLTCQA